MAVGPSAGERRPHRLTCSHFYQPPGLCLSLSPTPMPHAQALPFSSPNPDLVVLTLVVSPGCSAGPEGIPGLCPVFLPSSFSSHLAVSQTGHWQDPKFPTPLVLNGVGTASPCVHLISSHSDVTPCGKPSQNPQAHVPTLPSCSLGPAMSLSTFTLHACWLSC